MIITHLNDMNSKKLIDCLTDFEGAKGLNKDEKEKSLEYPFTKIAQKMLRGGYFLISGCDNEKYRIYIHSIEFYYHEELSDNKNMNETTRVCDWVMYHRNPLTGKKKEAYLTGTLHPHDSGIDITFEDQKNDPDQIRYRASALIRSFKVTKGDNEDFELFESFPPHISNPDKAVEYYPTHLKYYFFKQFPLKRISIEWIDKNEKITDLYKGIRINVFESTWDIKDNGQIYNLHKKTTKDNKPIRDNRKWAFCKDPIKLTFNKECFPFEKVVL